MAKSPRQPGPDGENAHVSAGESVRENTEAGPEAVPRVKRSKSRRVTTAPPAGSDPHPTGEPERHQNNENDERLKGDKPPHWG